MHNLEITRSIETLGLEKPAKSLIDINAGNGQSTFWQKILGIFGTWQSVMGSREEGKSIKWMNMSDSQAWPLTTEDLKSQLKTLGLVLVVSANSLTIEKHNVPRQINNQNGQNSKVAEKI